MSNKSARKTKTPSVPRAMEDIQRDHARLAMQAGGVQYQISVLGEELKTLNEQIKRLNNEGYARQQLDSTKKTETTEVDNGQQ